jgi:hypothetical protein
VDRERPEQSPRPAAAGRARAGDASAESWPAPDNTVELEHPVEPAPAPRAAPRVVQRPAARPAPAATVAPPAVYTPPVIARPGFDERPWRPQTDPSAILALSLAILAWLACPVFAAIAALMIAGGSKAKIEVSGGQYTGLGLVTATRWVAWIHIGLMSIGTLLLIAGVPLFGSLFR